MKHPPLPIQRGATLVEVLIVVVLLGMLGVYGTSMLSDNFRTVRSVSSGKRTADQLRYAVDRLSRELREIKYEGNAAGYAVSSTLAPSANSLVFTRNISGADTTVTVGLSGSNLTLGYSLPVPVTATLVQNVTAFSMNFYTVGLDSNGAVTTGATTSKFDLRYIEVSLTASDPVSGETLTERTRIALRSS